MFRKFVKENHFVVNYMRMWPHVKPFWFVALLSLLIGISIGALDAAISLFLKSYTDLVIVSNIVQVPWYLPFLIVGFTIVQHAIENLMQNKTVIIIAHRLSTIKNADKIAFIQEGEQAEFGTHEELMQIQNGLYKQFYESQFRKSRNAEEAVSAV